MTELHSRPDESPILRDVVGSVLYLTINRPHRRNALDGQGWKLLAQYLRDAAGDESVRVVVLAGAGHTFCAGADMSDPRPGHPWVRIREVHRIGELLQQLPKPVIAQVEGYAVGAGWSLALCADLVVASTDARFAAMFAKRGLSVDFGGSWSLVRLAGLQQAKRLVFLGETITAEEAADLGLVTWVENAAGIAEFVANLAHRLAAMPPIAVAQSKELLNAAAVGSFADALRQETWAQVVNHGTDAPRALRAFREGAEPEFTGVWGQD